MPGRDISGWANELPCAHNSNNIYVLGEFLLYRINYIALVLLITIALKFRALLDSIKCVECMNELFCATYNE